MTPLTINPLYSAPMILLPAPRRTKKVPITEPIMQTAPITNGSNISVSRSSAEPAVKIALNSMVATTVTA